jgi:hypothetical protein
MSYEYRYSAIKLLALRKVVARNSPAEYFRLQLDFFARNAAQSLIDSADQIL